MTPSSRQPHQAGAWRGASSPPRRSRRRPRDSARRPRRCALGTPGSSELLLRRRAEQRDQRPLGPRHRQPRNQPGRGADQHLAASASERIVELTRARHKGRGTQHAQLARRDQRGHQPASIGGVTPASSCPSERRAARPAARRPRLPGQSCCEGGSGSARWPSPSKNRLRQAWPSLGRRRDHRLVAFEHRFLLGGERVVLPLEVGLHADGLRLRFGLDAFAQAEFHSATAWSWSSRGRRSGRRPVLRQRGALQPAVVGLDRAVVKAHALDLLAADHAAGVAADRPRATGRSGAAAACERPCRRQRPTRTNRKASLRAPWLGRMSKPGDHRAGAGAPPSMAATMGCGQGAHGP